MLEKVNKANDVKIYSIEDDSFLTYGRILHGYDFAPILQYANEITEIPEVGNVYVASLQEFENLPIASVMENTIYGGMPIQIGYCNGKNTTYNGFEYHKGSEVNIAVTDFMLVLGHVWDIKKNTYTIENAQVFFVPAGTAFEMYQTTLHLSPCRVSDVGFKNIIVLPRGTNTPLEKREAKKDSENTLLLQKNKWVLAHPEREPLIKQGAYPGIIGENKELFY